MSISAIRNWIDDDLNKLRPWSGGLVTLCLFIGLWGLSEAGAPKIVQNLMLLIGVTVALPWFAYVTWRQCKKVFASFAQSAAFFRSRTGEVDD